MAQQLPPKLPTTEKSDRLRSGLALLSVTAFFCLSLEIEFLEQLDSLTLYMTTKEVLMDTGIALLMVLGMAIVWWLLVLAIARVFALSDRGKTLARSTVWHFGLLVPFAFLLFELMSVIEVGLHWQPKTVGLLVMVVLFLAACVWFVKKVSVSKLQEFSATRLAPLGWLHFGLGILAIVTLMSQGVHLFHDYAHPGNTTAAAAGSPDVYLITIDALRADDMSVYGYNRPTTPNLERFAQKATIFDYFFSNSNFTTTSTTSIETGKLPWSHRAFQLGGYIRGDAQRQNIAELMRERGYYTATITSNYLSSPILHKTVDSYDAAALLHPHTTTGAWMRYTNFTGLNTLYTLSSSLFNHLVSFRYYVDAWIWSDRYWSPAEEVFTTAEKLLDRTDIKQPRFVWTHILPPHDPYVAPPPFQKLFLSGGKLTHNMDYTRYRHEAPPPGVTVPELRARYDENIAYADHAVGDFLDWLDKTGRLEHSIVIISADHGESFEHHWLKHSGPYLFNALTHIPLLVHVPGQTTGGHASQAAEQVDLLPTILDLAGGGQAPAWADGTSLKPELEGKPVAQRFLYSMNLQPTSAFKPITKGSIAIMDDEFKYVDRMEAHAESLYRYRTDPGEEQDLVTSEPQVAERMRNALKDKLKEANERYTPKK